MFLFVSLFTDKHNCTFKKKNVITDIQASNTELTEIIAIEEMTLKNTKHFVISNHGSIIL